MRQNWKKIVSLLVALLLAVLPLVAVAEDMEEKTKQAQWRQEAIASGFYVKDEYALQVNSMPAVSEETLALIQETLDTLRLEVTTFDDVEAVYTHYALLMSGQEVLTVDVRKSESAYWFQTSLLPGHVLTAPLGEETPDGLLIPISPFSLFTVYLPNLPGGILSLSPEEAAFVDSDIASYLYELGSWVSVTQFETEKLYVYDFEQLLETATRDAVDRSFSTAIGAYDLQMAMRRMADVFYDDNRMQEVAAEYLSYFGVTRADTRKFADELPLMITALKAQDVELKYTAHYNDMDEMVGFELDVPRLYDKFPFEHLTANYEAKRGETGLVGKGSGEVLLDTEGSKIVADFALQRGDLIDGARSDLTSYEATMAMADGAEGSIRGYSQMDQRIDGDVEIIDYRYNTLQVGNEQTAQGDAGQTAYAQALGMMGQSSTDVTGTVTTTRLSEDGHFEGNQEYLVVGTGDQAAKNYELALTVKTTTGDYTVPDFSGEQTAMLTAPWAELDALRDEVVANAQAAGLKAMSLLPPEVLQAIGEGFTGK